MRAADAPTGPGDNRDLAVQKSHVPGLYHGRGAVDCELRCAWNTATFFVPMSHPRKPTDKFPAITEIGAGNTPPPSKPPSRPGLARPSMIDLEWVREEDTSVSRTTETALEIAPGPREKNRVLLTVTSGFNAGQVFTLEDREAIIGRGRDVHVRLEDSGVSRQHTRLV